MKISYFILRFIKKIKGSAIINSSIDQRSKIESGCQIVNVKMEKHSFCGYDCSIINCQIGKYCSISNRVIIGGGMHPIDWVSTSPVFYKGKDSVKTKFSTFERPEPKMTRIGNDVWIGEGVMIKQGVVIGDGAIIGMGSIVTKNVDPYTIVAGNPAKVIRKRFSEEVIEGLISIQFWNIDEKKLKYYAKFVREPAKFIDMVRK
jgi:acetyltransferase-like isoleucine patch superfamily enzyme